MDVIKLHNEIRSNKEVCPPEGIYVIQNSTTVEAITSDTSLYFTKLWLVPAKAVVAGVLTANGADVLWGKSGAAAGVTLTSLIVTAGEAVATFANHGYLDGQSITIAGATPAGLNGSWVIYGVTPNTFTWRTTAAAGPATGTITAARTKYLPWKLATTDIDGVAFELPLGQRMRLSEVIVRGTASDGIFYSFT